MWLERCKIIYIYIYIYIYISLSLSQQPWAQNSGEGWKQGGGHRVLVNGQWITVEWITVESWRTVDYDGQCAQGYGQCLLRMPRPEIQQFQTQPRCSGQMLGIDPYHLVHKAKVPML